MAKIILGTANNDRLYGENLSIEDNADRIKGLEGNDTLYGGAGNDKIYGGTGINVLYGGAGDDRIFGESSRAGDYNKIYGGDGNDFIKNVTSKGSYLDGGAGNDYLGGGAGNDSMYGGSGKDYFYGGAGDDFLKDGNSDNIFYGGDGNDTLSYNDGRFTANFSKLYGGNGHDVMTSGGSGDFVYGDAGNDKIYIQGGGHSYAYGGIGDDYIKIDGNGDETGKYSAYAGIGNDTIISNLQGAVISGGYGNDVIYTNANVGRDLIYIQNQVYGGAGDDRFYNLDDPGNEQHNGFYADPFDWIEGGIGNDTYTIARQTDIIEKRNSGIDTVILTADYKDWIHINYEEDDEATDIVQDYKLHENVENLVVNGSHYSKLTGNQLNNKITGNSGNNEIYGAAGNDVINGGKGADMLSGGAGRDILYGGASDGIADRFVYASHTDSRVEARDVVYDFVSGQDKIELAGMDADITLSGNQAFTFNDTIAKKNALWYKDIGNNIIVYADVNRDAIADFEMEIANINSLKATDFIL